MILSQADKRIWRFFCSSKIDWHSWRKWGYICNKGSRHKLRAYFLRVCQSFQASTVQEERAI